jgi:hypothetical protein
LLDYPHYQKTGELLYRRMDHDSGWIAKFKWEKKKARFPLKNTVAFRPSRTAKRTLTHAIKHKGSMIKYIHPKTI